MLRLIHQASQKEKGLVFSMAWVSEHSAWSASRPVALWHFCGVVLLSGITSGPLAITGSVLVSKGHLLAALHIHVVLRTLLSIQGFSRLFGVVYRPWCPWYSLPLLNCQLYCLDSFPVVVRVGGVFSIHGIVGSCGGRTFLTIVGFCF